MFYISITSIVCRAFPYQQTVIAIAFTIQSLQFALQLRFPFIEVSLYLIPFQTWHIQRTFAIINICLLFINVFVGIPQA